MGCFRVKTVLSLIGRLYPIFNSTSWVIPPQPTFESSIRFFSKRPIPDKLKIVPHLDFLALPPTNPSSLFELYRSNYATEVLVAAVSHFHFFERIESEPLRPDQISATFALSQRASVVLLTALRALGLVTVSTEGLLTLPESVRQHLLPNDPYYIGDYFSLASQSPGVLALIDSLRNSRPAVRTSHGPGAAFIYRDGIESAMDVEQSARSLTLALTGRARNVAPYLARLLRFSPGDVLLDVGAGSGLYSIALLQANPGLQVIALDRSEVLKVVEEFADAAGVRDRIELLPGNMFEVTFPTVDAVLLSNVLHDWDIPECRLLVNRCASALKPEGRLLIHDAFLSDDLSGPVGTALYSIALFTLTEGRAYSRAEMAEWLAEVGFDVGPVIPTLVLAGLLMANRPAH